MHQNVSVIGLFVSQENSTRVLFGPTVIAHAVTSPQAV